VTNYITIIQQAPTTTGGKIYAAIHPDLPHCIAQGYTAEEARRNLAEVRADWFDHANEFNLPVPEPRLISNNFVFAWDCENLCEVETRTR